MGAVRNILPDLRAKLGAEKSRSLTASDIARHIQRPGESLTAAIDRFRNWSKMGIITPAGDYHPGTGRKKLYTTAALLEAVLLQTLTDTFGSSAVSLRPLIDQISRMVRKGVLPETIVDEKVLVLSRPHGAEAIAIAQVKPKDLGKYVMDSDLDVHMIVNVNRLFDPLPYKWEDALQGETLLSRHQKAEMLRKPKRGRR